MFECLFFKLGWHEISLVHIYFSDFLVLTIFYDQHYVFSRHPQRDSSHAFPALHYHHCGGILNALINVNFVNSL